jgi:hypothetical protein
MSDFATIHMADGERIHVPGTVGELQAALNRPDGLLIHLKTKNDLDVLVNPAHVVRVDFNVPRRRELVQH